MKDTQITKYFSVMLENKCNDCPYIDLQVLKDSHYKDMLSDYIIVCGNKELCKHLEEKFKRGQ